jgi:hypothetical protein
MDSLPVGQVTKRNDRAKTLKIALESLNTQYLVSIFLKIFSNPDHTPLHISWIRH